MTTYPTGVLKRPFGAASRTWMIEKYFSEQIEPITAANAWQHVYRLLLWIDRTTALAHCYESDKAQPGRHWYQRSLAFHQWVSESLGVSPMSLHRDVDYLFRLGTRIMAIAEATEQVSRLKRAERQRQPFAALRMPEPGTDPELEEEVTQSLSRHYGEPVSPELVREIITTVKSNLALENKRKNLVGEGFEDVLAALVTRLLGTSGWSVYCRKPLHELPGFRVPPQREKVRKVDLALVSGSQPNRRVLATVKWSVRADREEQFGVDHDAYARLEEFGDPFEFVLITNEFDAARLVAAVERRHMMAGALFTSVVHVNPAGVLATYGADARATAEKLPGYCESGRIKSLGNWMEEL